MTHDVFYTEPEHVGVEELNVSGDEFRHLSRVLRKRVGDEIVVTDGCGRLFRCIVQTMSRTTARCRIREVRTGENEPKIRVTLALSLLKNPGRLETAIEKCVELGVRTVVPIICERTIGKRVKRERMQGIALAALKQSGRCVLPDVWTPATFAVVLDSTDPYELKLIPHEKAGPSEFIARVLEQRGKVESVLIVIGPEGGFSDGEMTQAVSRGCIPVSLGPRRLRSETAAIRAVSYAVGEW